VSGNSNTYVKKPELLGQGDDRGHGYKLPFVDKLTYRTIKDEATYITALRTAKIDMLEYIRWQNVEQLKKSAPALQWSRWLNMSGTFLSMRVDTKPFDDIRVRRALNMAVNKQEIVSSYYNGNAELFAYPQHPDYLGYFEPLETDAGLGQGAVHATTRPRRSSCSPRPAIRTASASRSRSAHASPTTWSCCRWSPPISSRSA
jgi:peptide/nickel transport system substrate-binding protein